MLVYGQAITLWIRYQLVFTFQWILENKWGILFSGHRKFFTKTTIMV